MCQACYRWHPPAKMEEQARRDAWYRTARRHHDHTPQCVLGHTHGVMKSDSEVITSGNARDASIRIYLYMRRVSDASNVRNVKSKVLVFTNARGAILECVKRVTNGIHQLKWKSRHVVTLGIVPHVAHHDHTPQCVLGHT